MSPITRQTIIALSAFGLVAACATGAYAQVDTHAAVQRYNRVARGASVDEWHRRIFEEDVQTRLEAVESLGKDGGEESVKPLLDATADSDPRVRAKAIDYLGMIGDRHATPLLTQYLFLNDVDDHSKQRILVALGRIKDPESVDKLQLFAQKTDDEVLQCAALHALGEVGAPSSKTFVERYAQADEPEQIQRIAVDALAKIETNASKRRDEQPTILQLEKAFRPPEKR